jgi:hypothetical protein
MDETDVAQRPDWRSGASFPPMPPIELDTKRPERARRTSREQMTPMIMVFLVIPMTLLALLFVVGLLMTLMLPTHRPSSDKQTQSVLRVTLTDAQAMFGDSGSYEGATASGLAGSEPGYSYVDQHTEPTLPNAVSVAATKTTFVAAAKSKSGRCFFIVSSEPSGTQYAETKDRLCAAANAPAPASPLWLAAWPWPSTT